MQLGLQRPVQRGMQEVQLALQRGCAQCEQLRLHAEHCGCITGGCAQRTAHLCMLLLQQLRGHRQQGGLAHGLWAGGEKV